VLVAALVVLVTVGIAVVLDILGVTGVVVLSVFVSTVVGGLL